MTTLLVEISLDGQSMWFKAGLAISEVENLIRGKCSRIGGRLTEYAGPAGMESRLLRELAEDETLELGSVYHFIDSKIQPIASTRE